MTAFHENTREAFGPHFTVAPIEGGTEILLAGALLIMIEHDDRLPAGFHDRLVRHVMDLLSGRRSALWDEQAVFGDRDKDDASVRALAAAYAEQESAARETSQQPEKGSLSHEPPTASPPRES